MTKDELRNLREKSGKTQAALAADLGVPQPRVSEWERGVRPLTRREELAIVHVLRCLSKQR